MFLRIPGLSHEGSSLEDSPSKGLLGVPGGESRGLDDLPPPGDKKSWKLSWEGLVIPCKTFVRWLLWDMMIGILTSFDELSLVGSSMINCICLSCRAYSSGSSQRFLFIARVRMSDYCSNWSIWSGVIFGKWGVIGLVPNMFSGSIVEQVYAQGSVGDRGFYWCF